MHIFTLGTKGFHEESVVVWNLWGQDLQKTNRHFPFGQHKNA